MPLLLKFALKSDCFVIDLLRSFTSLFRFGLPCFQSSDYSRNDLPELFDVKNPRCQHGPFSWFE